MAEPSLAGTTRVVLLARPGPACDRLREALQQAGADLVLVADPTAGDVAAVTAAAPQAVLVALDSAVEDTLELFDSVLADPAVTVIFDEAELAALRAGWDSARWVRHLSAKLNHHHDVLPPGGEAESTWHPSPGPILKTSERLPDLDIATFAGEAQERADRVPRDPGMHVDGMTFGEGLVSDDGGVTAHDAVSNDDLDTALDFDFKSAGVPDQNTSVATSDSKPGVDLEELERRVATIQLADADSYGHGPKRGAVLVEAGLGGPDAVRQLLAELPEKFPRPVLVRLRLDGGR
ncbi:MAG: chemotaxis protein, partial [Luteimonas sp.]